MCPNNNRKVAHKPRTINSAGKSDRNGEMQQADAKAFHAQQRGIEEVLSGKRKALVITCGGGGGEITHSASSSHYMNLILGEGRGLGGVAYRASCPKLLESAT